MTATRWTPPSIGALACAFVSAAVLWSVTGGESSAALRVSSAAVTTRTFVYTSHAGIPRKAYIVLPAWYGERAHPSIPLVISPHGRGVDGAYNLRFWGTLPARGRFALISPDGQGRKLPLYSWGYDGQIDDLSRLPGEAQQAFQWLRIDPERIYAVGDSMGAHEALLLAAHHPGVRLAGVAAFDPVTDMALRYRAWFTTPGERDLPAKARIEFGGTPAQVPHEYAVRSPVHWLGALAASHVPIELWWSSRDRVITDQTRQTGAFYRRLVALAPDAPVQQITGYWQHAHEMHATTQLPAALACLGLLSPRGIRVPAYVRESRGAVAELPPERHKPSVPFSRSFCGRARV